MRILIAALVSLTAVTAGAAQRPVPSHRTPAPVHTAVREVARVNGVALTSDRLDSAVSALVPMESFHRNVSPEKMTALRQKALGQLVDDELEYQDGVRLGIGVTPTELNAGVRDAARRYGGLQGFETALRQTGATLAAARREIRRSITIRKTVSRVVTEKCQVSQGEASSFFTANPDRFVEPEQLHVFAITIGVDPSSTASQWAAAKTRAEDVRQQLTAGASFDELARKYSTDPSKASGGDMGFVHRGSLSDKFEQIASALAPGRTSDVVETLYGYHIVRVTETRAPQKRTFAEIGASLQRDLIATRCAETRDAWLTRLRSAATIVLSE